MKILDVRDIDFVKLEMLDILSSEGTLYFDDKLFYKFYDYLINFERKEKKLILLNSSDNNFNAIVPHILIKNKQLFCGCAMDFVKDSKSLVEYKKSTEFISLLYNISLSLMKIHNDPRNIAIGDLHFNNILIDNKFNHYFVDFDSCKIDDIKEDRHPDNLLSYVKKRGDFDFDINTRTDKLCMILSFINTFFDKQVDDLSMYEYDEKAEEIYTLKNLRECVTEIKNALNSIPYVPYLHEVISEKDLKRIRNIR